MMQLLSCPESKKCAFRVTSRGFRWPRRWFPLVEPLQARNLLSRFTEYPIPTPISGAGGITTGPDSRLWFTEEDASKIGAVTLDGTFAGAFMRYDVPAVDGSPLRITSGPDGALRFTSSAGKIGRVTVEGTFSDFAAPSSTDLNGITTGSDGNLWFVSNGGLIGRLTP